MRESTRAGRAGRAAAELGEGRAVGDGRVLAVVGACGGAGTSTVAAAVAHGLRRAGERAALVDVDAPGAGVEVLLGLEAEPGARWPELATARGDVDGRGLLAALPRWGAVPVLSVSRLAASPPPDEVVLDVCSALLRSGESAVLDLPRPAAWTAGVRALVSAADAVLLVVPLTMLGAAGAVSCARQLGRLRPEGPDPRLVLRGPAAGRVDDTDVERLTGLPVAARLRWDARTAGAIERGEGPPVGRRTALGRFAAGVAGAA